MLSLLLLPFSFLTLCLPCHLFQVIFREHFLEPSTFLAAEVTVMTEADPGPLPELTDNCKNVYLANYRKLLDSISNLPYNSTTSLSKNWVVTIWQAIINSQASSLRFLKDFLVLHVLLPSFLNVLLLWPTYDSNYGMAFKQSHSECKIIIISF